MLINLKNMLHYAAMRKIAVGSFNVYNVESLQAVVKASRATGKPVIISFGESYVSHMPLEVMADMVKNYCAAAEIPVVLHLDHSKNSETIFKALKAGFTSVMYDGSALELAENIRRTRYIAEIAHALDASVEGELGYMNNEDGSAPEAFVAAKGYTTIAAAKEYAEKSGADALAIAIGNAHGIYKGEPVLDFDRLRGIAAKVEIPLVLHGSSGIPAASLQRAITLGIRKININTEISTAGIKAARNFLESHTDENTRFEALAGAAEEVMFATVKNYIELFESVG